jgi:hypothetical protein
MNFKFLLIITLGQVILASKTFTQTYQIPGAVKQPAWVFPFWIEDGSGQIDTLYFGYDPDSRWEFGGSDTVYGEYRIPKSDTSFFTSLSEINDSGCKVNISPWFVTANQANFFTNIYLSNGKWPITIKYDVSLFYSDALPISGNFYPKAYGEVWCSDWWPNSDYNCELQVPSFFMTDSMDWHFPEFRIRPDSIYLTGNNELTSPNMRFHIGFKDFTQFWTGISQLDKDKADFSISPNPANEFIQIKPTFSENYLLNITNILGKQAFATTLFTGESKIDISHFLPGIYIVKIESVNAVKMFKIIKN